MNLCAAISVAAFVVGLAVAALAFFIARAPRWARYRELGAVALTAAVFTLGELTQSLTADPDWILPVARIQSVFAVLYVLAWQFYADRHLERRPGRVERGARLVFLWMGVVWLVPGVMYDDRLTSFALPSLGCRITFPDATPLGSLAYLSELVLLFATLLRYRAAWKRGVYGAAGHVAAIATMLVAAVHDVCVTLGAYHGMFLLSTGFLGSLAALGVLMARDFMREAEELDRLKGELEGRVETRTAELLTAEAALMRSEKLAAIGQLSAGVAHEVNNPAAVVRANLEWLRGEIESGAKPDDALESIDDSLEAIDRIAKIVRQLLDLGRAASSQTGSVQLARVVERALATARTSFRADLGIVVDVPESLGVRGDETSVVQVLVNLLVNGAQAIPTGRPGTLRVIAAQEGERVHVRVIDDGTGMTEETRKRAFEPFFTTKPFGEGTGLGLALSLGIARSLGGDLDCVSRPGETTMTLTLLHAEPTHAVSESRRSAVPVQRLLLVEDDERVRRAFSRMLSSSFAIEAATGVEDALEHLGRGTFDIVLSDWKMPEGGGRRLHEEAAARWPSLGASFVFVTGGGLSVEDEEFLANHRVLDKPLSVEKLLEAIATGRTPRSGLAVGGRP